MDVKAELVRIDSTGEAHAIGKIASQRLRARAGVYRMLPSPGHVVFFRYTGDDGNRDVSDGAIVKLAGEITQPGALCDVLALVSQTGWRGELLVFEELTTRSLFIDQGNVLGITTSVEEERIGAVLYRYGALSASKYAAINAKLDSSGRRFGDIAVDLGALSQEQVYAHIRRQIEEVFCATLTISDGTFYFLEGFDDARLPTRHAINLNALLMDGVTRLDEMRYFRQKIPSADHVPVRHVASEPPGADFEKTYNAVDGTSTVEEIGRATGLGEFDTTKQLYALIQSKHVVIHPPKISGGTHALVELANDALRRIFEAVDSQGKGELVRSGLSSFAVGAGVYDILFRGAGPNEHGELEAGQVADNFVVLSAGGSGNPVNLLKQILHEYVGFALFCASGALSSGASDELVKSVSKVLAQLRPIG